VGGEEGGGEGAEGEGGRRYHRCHLDVLAVLLYHGCNDDLMRCV